MTLMLDSGVRRGVDALTALCLGAKFVFVGRATLYAAAVGGRAGVADTIKLLRREIDLTLAQIGCPSLDQLGPDFLMWDRDHDWRRNRRD
jgi:L-lactate dehydrogenase (cytochrome)/(S)-mandelate dehydrogenase